MPRSWLLVPALFVLGSTHVRADYCPSPVVFYPVEPCVVFYWSYPVVLPCYTLAHVVPSSAVQPAAKSASPNAKKKMSPADRPFQEKAATRRAPVVSESRSGASGERTNTAAYKVGLWHLTGGDVTRTVDGGRTPLRAIGRLR